MGGGQFSPPSWCKYGMILRWNGLNFCETEGIQPGKSGLTFLIWMRLLLTLEQMFTDMFVSFRLLLLQANSWSTQSEMSEAMLGRAPVRKTEHMYDPRDKSPADVDQEH